MNIYKIWSRLLILCVGCLFLTTACSDDDPEPLPSGECLRTVLVYIVADDNGLQDYVSYDLDEMVRGLKQIAVLNGHLLVYMDTGSPCLFELEKKGQEVVKTLVKEYKERNSVGVSETLEVFNDVFDNKRFQAQSYGLVYWSHGDGWIPNPLPSTRWIGQDNGQGSHYMNISDLVSILDEAPHFDFILFDACFMLSVEVGYELRDYADYILGSPTETPGTGAPYDKILPHMFAEDAAIPMAQAYFKAYQDIYDEGRGISNNNWTGGTAIGVMKTSELERLAQATSGLCSDALAAGTINDADLTSAFNYDKRSTYSSLYVGYYDMVELAQMLAPSDVSFNTWKQAYDAVLVSWQTTPKVYSSVRGMFSMERANGLSHYLPRADRASAAKAYQSTAWYQDAGLAALGF